MKVKSKEKPFYFEPPWNILFEIRKMQKIHPWDVKISFILPAFLEEMEKRVGIDFRASGIILDSSADIYLMKSKMLLELEEPPKIPETKFDFIPPPLILPLRYEMTTTTIQNLLDALDDTLKDQTTVDAKKSLQSSLISPPEIIPVLSSYMMEIEDQINRMYQKILYISKNGNLITYSIIVQNLETMERVRTFVILLFLAQKEKISLWQEEDFGEIYITLTGG